MEFKKIELGKIIDIRNGYAFKSKDFTEKGVPVLKIKNVKPNKILLKELSYISEDDLPGKAG